jgi:transcriptional regulator with XRE-family HTH domain
MPKTNLTEPAYRAFVMHLVALRARAGLGQVELARRLGKPQSYVSKTERFERRLDPAEFRAWVLAMGADPAAEFAAVSATLGPPKRPVSGEFSGE